MNICFINQNAGLGDIFLCQKIAKLVAQLTEYKRIIWPVISENIDVKDYLIGQNIEYVDEKSEFYGREHLNSFKIITTNQIQFGQKVTHIEAKIGEDSILYIPLEKASYAVNAEVMESKFKLIGVTSEHWQDFFEFRRNAVKEKLLIETLGIKESEDFILENRCYSTTEYNGKISHKFNKQSNCKSIELRRIHGFSIFDWCGVFERAKEIHSVNTSINFILEKIDCTDQLFMYKRPEEDSQQFIKEEYLFKKKYQRFL